MLLNGKKIRKNEKQKELYYEMKTMLHLIKTNKKKE